MVIDVELGTRGECFDSGLAGSERGGGFLACGVLALDASPSPCARATGSRSKRQIEGGREEDARCDVSVFEQGRQGRGGMREYVWFCVGRNGGAVRAGMEATWWRGRRAARGEEEGAAGGGSSDGDL